MTTPLQGPPGMSAYEVAVAEGFVGTEAQWVASLKGATGATGSLGATGPQGPAGVQGPTGSRGATGAQGPAGPAGPRGITGATGATGAQGPAGPAGATGATGATGLRGLQGLAGTAGATGPQGGTGARGPAGPAGATGAQGPAGPAGARGVAGPQGPQGLPTTVNGKTGSSITLTASDVGALTLATANATYTSLANGTDWLNVKALGAAGNGTTDDTTVLQSVLNSLSASGGTVYFPAGTYKITTALTVGSNVTLRGTGDQDSVISQATTSAHALSGFDVTNVSLMDLGLTGPGSGTGNGVNFGLVNNNATTYISMRNVTIKTFGGDGVNIKIPIVSAFERVVSQGCGGYGFNVYGITTGAGSPGTSCSFRSCYGNGCGTGGFRLYKMSYTELNSCAADNNPIGYLVDQGWNVVLSGCGSEGNTTGVEINGGYGNSVHSQFVFDNAGTGIWVTGSAHLVGLYQVTDVSPGAGATNFIKVDAGSFCTIVGQSNTTANALNGTVGIFDDGGGGTVVPGYAYFSGQVEINNTLTMDNHKISGIASGTAATDAVNVSQIPAPASVIQVPPPTGVAATDLAAISAAIAALPSTGGVIQLQAGKYVVPAPASPSNGCISMTVNSSVLRGMGMGVTTIQLAPGSAGVTGIIRTPSGVANSEIQFRDLSIDGNAANQTGAPTVIGFFCGVTPNSTATDTDIRCENVEIYGCTGYGFDPHERTTRLVLKNCISHNNGSDGVHDGFTLDACYDSVVEGCIAYSNGRHGFNLVTASNNVTLTGCKSYSNGGNGYTLQNGAKNNVLVDCTANGNTLDGVYINGVAQTGQQDNTPGVNNAVKGSTIRLSGAHGIHLVGASHNHINGNTIRDSSQTATNTSHQIYLDESGTVYSTYNTVANNDLDITAGVTNAPKYGIREKSSSDDNNFVIGNRSQGAVTSQISLLGATSLRLAAHNGVNEHPPTAPYVQDTPTQHGLAEWNFQPSIAGSTSTVTAGKVYLSRLTIQTGGLLSNVVINITTAGSGLTASYVGIFDATGTQLAVSADISASLTGTGGIALPFPAYFFTPGSTVLVALLVGNASTTPPTLARGASGSGARNFGLSTASPLVVSTYSSGLTAMPASLTLASTTASGAVDFWCGLE